MSTTDAKGHNCISGIENGDWVFIENERGKIKQKALVTDDIDERVVAIEMGWWFPIRWVEGDGSMVRLVAEIDEDDLTGAETRIYKYGDH